MGVAVSPWLEPCGALLAAPLAMAPVTPNAIAAKSPAAAVSVSALTGRRIRASFRLQIVHCPAWVGRQACGQAAPLMLGRRQEAAMMAWKPFP